MLQAAARCDQEAPSHPLPAPSPLPQPCSPSLNTHSQTTTFTPNPNPRSRSSTETLAADDKFFCDKCGCLQEAQVGGSARQREPVQPTSCHPLVGSTPPQHICTCRQSVQLISGIHCVLPSSFCALAPCPQAPPAAPPPPGRAARPNPNSPTPAIPPTPPPTHTHCRRRCRRRSACGWRSCHPCFVCTSSASSTLRAWGGEGLACRPPTLRFTDTAACTHRLPA